MKGQLKGFISGVLVTLLLLGSMGTAMAAVGSKPANLEYNDIKVTLDGTPINLVDAAGNTVEPFIISGTTYLPVRAVAGALGLDVNWDAATKTVILTRPGSAQPNPAPSPAPTGTPTMGQKNALEQAKRYLSISAFSYSGLIDQLKYEGYTTEEATYGADNCGADWNEQAAKKAQQYINTMSFSRQGLIDQLKYEGFTQAQAEYGASNVSTEEQDELQRTIYITKTGKRYHYDSSCNGGTYIPSTLGEALRRGLTPCDKCVLK